MDFKNEFISVYKENITRDGADKLLEYLLSPASDFFTAPASTRYHGSYEGGLCEHSLNVYKCLKDYLNRERVKNEYNLVVSHETIAIVSLLHDLCKVNCYKTSFRNAKDESGKWVKVPYFEYDDKLPYGHGEKSVYIITGFMRLSREESFAIRYHMGFSQAGDDMRNISAVFEMFPLALATFVADMEASYMVEKRG